MWKGPILWSFISMIWAMEMLALTAQQKFTPQIWIGLQTKVCVLQTPMLLLLPVHQVGMPFLLEYTHGEIKMPPFYLERHR